MSYTIKEVSETLSLPSTTIRYYEKEGLLPNICRRESGYRSFSDDDISMLRMIECLKATGMPIKDIRTFTEWLMQGDETLGERLHMFMERRRAVEKQIEELKNALEVIDYKIWYYEAAIEAGTEKVHLNEDGSHKTHAPFK